NAQQGPIYTDANGSFSFAGLPEGEMTLIVSGAGFRRRQLKVAMLADEVTQVAVDLKPAGQPIGKIKVKGLQVSIADEAIFVIEETGQQLSLQQYLDHTRAKVLSSARTSDLAGLIAVWVDRDRRQQFIADLQAASVFTDVLAEVLNQTEADQLDLLAHIAFGAPIRTRSERATAFVNREGRFLQQHATPAREVILSLLDKYRAAGIEEISDPRVFRLPPFLQMGQAPGIVRRFGSAGALRASLQELQRRLYS
ncbi:MAG: restriction endonuclease subunit R, partial [Chloroflexi bacterium]|nr:restriction endonuclease subunit R [Chloroflexota bacterium]